MFRTGQGRAAGARMVSKGPASLQEGALGSSGFGPWRVGAAALALRTRCSSRAPSATELGRFSDVAHCHTWEVCNLPVQTSLLLEKSLPSAPRIRTCTPPPPPESRRLFSRLWPLALPYEVPWVKMGGCSAASPALSRRASFPQGPLSLGQVSASPVPQATQPDPGLGLREAGSSQV